MPLLAINIQCCIEELGDGAYCILFCLNVCHISPECVLLLLIHVFIISYHMLRVFIAINLYHIKSYHILFVFIVINSYHITSYLFLLLLIYIISYLFLIHDLPISYILLVVTFFNSHHIISYHIISYFWLVLLFHILLITYHFKVHTYSYLQFLVTEIENEERCRWQ